ncbi:hypothetical protein BDF14DRAFT_1742504 [Spinellus fusiger]|nr:hypothetical protein BDF14DRAFT_1742504 [Spinellus fusiger]
MAKPLTRKLFVVGGNGSLGQRICQLSVEKGWETVSLSRRGEPTYATPAAKPAWAHKVKWVTGNSLEPATYHQTLKGVTDVVHTVGILLESDYKALARATTAVELGKGLLHLASGVFGMKDNGNPLSPAHSPVTYEQMNRDTAVTVAQQAAQQSTVDSFVYVSATDTLPFVDPRYITTKREAESFLLSLPQLRPIILRPALMYSEERLASVRLASVLQCLNSMTRPFSRDIASLPLGPLLTTPPLLLDTVAHAVVSGIDTPTARGLFDVEGLQRLASQS